MVVIFSVSSDTQSFHHSSTLFEPLMHWLFPQMPQPRIEHIHYLFRKCAHLTEYALLALLLWRAIHHTHGKRRRPAGEIEPPPNGKFPWLWPEAGLALALVFLYAASDEIHQVFIPGRTGQVSDVLVDTTGGIIGLGLLWLSGKVLKHW